MIWTRRAVVSGLGATAAASCAPAVEPLGGVAAAGQPAAVLIQALAPDALLGWPRRPSEAALTLLRPTLAALPELGALTASDAPASLEAMAARGPRLVLDYGDAGPGLDALAARTRERLGVPWERLDGALDRTPEAIRRAGALVDRADAAGRLALFARDMLSAWRGAARTGGPRFYLARGADGLETADGGALAAQVLEGAGWINVVPPQPGKGLPRVSLEQVAAWAPDRIVTQDAAFAARARRDPVWTRGEADRIVLVPRLPFGWLDQPPSINRLLGCAWTVFGDDWSRLFDAVRQFHALAYGRDLAPADMDRLTA